MVNTVTYFLHYDLDDDKNVVIGNESFDDMITAVMNMPCGLKLTLIDRFGIANSKMDDIVNEFVNDCRQRDDNRYCPYPYNDGFGSFPAVLKSFIGGLLEVTRRSFAGDFDVFNSQTLFRVKIPAEYLSAEKIEEFLALGPDDLFAQPFPHRVFVENILPAYYLDLYAAGKLSEKSGDTDLRKYKIGLH